MHFKFSPENAATLRSHRARKENKPLELMGAHYSARAVYLGGLSRHSRLILIMSIVLVGPPQLSSKINMDGGSRRVTGDVRGPRSLVRSG